MRRSRKNEEAQVEQAEGDTKVSPEEASETGNVTSAVEQEGADPDNMKLSKEDQQSIIASNMGGSDQYAYVDRTAVPMHERNLSVVNNPHTEASQAELNPAFYPKKEDGGPVNAEGESIGSEPNAFEQQLAAAENSGDEKQVQAVKDQQAEGEKQQMDVEKVNAQAEERTPDNVDAETGQPKQ